MKILHLIDSGGLYGAEKMLLTLVAEQVRGGLSPLILSVGVPGITEKALEVEARRLGLPLKVWRMKPGLNFREALHIARWAKSENFQIFHSHGYKFNILLGLLPKLLRKIPVVTTLHGYTSTKKYTKMWINELLDRYALTRVDRVVLVRQGMSEVLGKWVCSKASLCIIENGIDLKNAEDSIDSALDNSIDNFIKRPGPIVCAVGRLSREKGFLVLLDALSILKSRVPDLKLILLGDGLLRSDIECKVKYYSMSEQVLLTGFFENPLRVMRRCDVLAIPSFTEGLPITLLEAMAVKCPIVASAVGGIPHVLKDGLLGWLVPPGDITALSDALLYVLENREAAASKSQDAYLEVVNKYSSKSMSDNYSNVYSEVVEFE